MTVGATIEKATIEKAPLVGASDDLSRVDLNSDRPGMLIAAAVLMLALLGFLDYLTGPDIGLSPFYLIPIGLAAWFGGTRIGVAMSFVGAIVWFAAVDVNSDRQPQITVIIWNDLVRLSFFLVVSYLLCYVRTLTDSLRLRVTERSEALATELVSHEQTRHVLEETEQQFQVLVEGVRDCGMFMLDPEGRIISWNRGGELLTGFHSADVLQQPFSWLWPPNDPRSDRLEEILRQTVRDGSIRREGWYRRRRDKPFWAVTILTALKHQDGTVNGHSAVIQDITEHKRLEDELLAREEGDRQHIGRELHDVLGQELTGLALLSKELEDRLAARDLPEAQLAAKVYRSASQSVEQARRLSQGLCFMGDRAEGLATALQELALNAEDVFGVRCEFESTGDFDLTNPNVQLHLYRIAQEAITNAVKHGNASRIKLDLMTDKQQCVLTIDNNGQGLSEDSSKRIGIGTSIMQYRARALGGYLSLQSRPAGGVTVVCTIPALKPQEEFSNELGEDENSNC